MFDRPAELWNDAQLNMFFDRIGLKRNEITGTTYDDLAKLFNAFMSSVPFEDIDVYSRGSCPSLYAEDLFEKICVRKRGGYCYEKNSTFCHLLRSLGFDAYVVVLQILTKPQVTEPDHCSVICTIDGIKHYCDVGFGGPAPSEPLPFGRTGSNGFTLKGEKDDYILYAPDGSLSMHFFDHPMPPVYLHPFNFNVSQKEDAKFALNLVLNIEKDGKSYSVNNNSFKIHDLSKQEDVVEKTVTDKAEMIGIIRDCFGIPETSYELKDDLFV